MSYFDKEFVMYLAKYIGENDNTSVKYLNAFHFIFNDILKYKDDGKKQIINNAYRFWNFKDNDILDFIYGKDIPINKSGFLSYFSNIGNTKFMIDFLEINNNQKLFYLIEESHGEFMRIYTPLEHINEDEYSADDLEYIEEVLSKFKKENEFIKVKNTSYALNIKNTKSILIHEWLGDLLELNDTHKFNNGYYYVLLTKENIKKMKESEAFNYLNDYSYLINSIGCSVFDNFHDIDYVDYLIESGKVKDENESDEDIDENPTKVCFKSNN